MSTGDPRERLIVRLREISPPLQGDDERSLREMVCEYVDALKAQGHTPERIVTGIKHAAGQAGLRTTIGRWTTSETQSAVERLLDQIIAWGIGHYFATSSPKAP